MGILTEARRRVRTHIAELIAVRIADLLGQGVPYRDAVPRALADFAAGRLTK